MPEAAPAQAPLPGAEGLGPSAAALIGQARGAKLMDSGRRLAPELGTPAARPPHLPSCSDAARLCPQLGHCTLWVWRAEGES